MAPKLIEKVVRPEPTENSLNRTEFVDKPDWMIDPVKAENNLHYVEGVVEHVNAQVNPERGSDTEHRTRTGNLEVTGEELSLYWEPQHSMSRTDGLSLENSIKEIMGMREATGEPSAMTQRESTQKEKSQELDQDTQKLEQEGNEVNRKLAEAIKKWEEAIEKQDKVVGEQNETIEELKKKVEELKKTVEEQNKAIEGLKAIAEPNEANQSRQRDTVLRIAMSNRSALGAIGKICRCTRCPEITTQVGYIAQAAGTIWGVVGWACHLLHPASSVGGVAAISSTGMSGAGKFCKFIGKILRNRRDRAQGAPSTYVRGFTLPRPHGGFMLSTRRVELPSKGEAGPDYWKILGDDIPDWNVDHLLQSIFEEFKLQGIKNDVTKWREADVPDIFNHIFSWFDALNVDFWNDCANQVNHDLENKEAIAAEIITTEFFRVMSQFSDETHKGNFVWEDPAEETKLVRDLFAEFKKGGVKSIYSYMATYQYQHELLLREVGCEVVLKALITAYIVA